jgi:hypothetical protein
MNHIITGGQPSEQKKRPTIAELEAILNDPQGGTVEILADGSIVVDAELTRLRATIAALETRVALLERRIEAVRYAVDGYIDGAPDCNAVSKLANEVSLIIDPT